MEIRISDLLARLPIPGLRESRIRHVIAEEITSLLGIPVRPNQVDFIDGILSIRVPPVVKSALGIRKEELTQRLAPHSISLREIR